MWQTCFRLQKYDFIKLRSETIYKILLGKFRKSYLKISNCISSFRLRCNFIILLLGHYNISELSLYFYSLYLAEQTLVFRIKYTSFFSLQRSRVLRKDFWCLGYQLLTKCDEKISPPPIVISRNIPNDLFVGKQSFKYSSTCFKTFTMISFLENFLL